MLALERVVLEALERGARKFEELLQETNLAHLVLVNLLSRMLMSNVINYQKGYYYLGLSRQSESEASGVVDEEELKELVLAMISGKFGNLSSGQNHFCLKKVWLNQKEERIFKQHIDSFNLFLSRVEERNRASDLDDKQLLLGRKKVILSGYANYSSLVKNMVTSA